MSKPFVEKICNHDEFKKIIEMARDECGAYKQIESGDYKKIIQEDYKVICPECGYEAMLEFVRIFSGEGRFDDGVYFHNNDKEKQEAKMYIEFLCEIIKGGLDTDFMKKEVKEFWESVYGIKAP